IVLAFSNQRIINLYPMILIPGSLNLFRCALTVSNLSDIDRIIKDSRQEGSGEIIVFLSPCFLLGITMLIQIIADGVKSHIFMNIFLEDNPDHFCIRRINGYGVILLIKIVTKWSLSAIPFSFTRFLLSAFHRL